MATSASPNGFRRCRGNAQSGNHCRKGHSQLPCSLSTMKARSLRRVIARSLDRRIPSLDGYRLWPAHSCHRAGRALCEPLRFPQSTRGRRFVSHRIRRRPVPTPAAPEPGAGSALAQCGRNRVRGLRSLCGSSPAQCKPISGGSLRCGWMLRHQQFHHAGWDTEGPGRAEITALANND